MKNIYIISAFLTLFIQNLHAPNEHEQKTMPLLQKTMPLLFYQKDSVSRNDNHVKLSFFSFARSFFGQSKATDLDLKNAPKNMQKLSLDEYMQKLYSSPDSGLTAPIFDAKALIQKIDILKEIKAILSLDLNFTSFPTDFDANNLTSFSNTTDIEENTQRIIRAKILQYHANAHNYALQLKVFEQHHIEQAILESTTTSWPEAHNQLYNSFSNNLYCVFMQNITSSPNQEYVTLESIKYAIEFATSISLNAEQQLMLQFVVQNLSDYLCLETQTTKILHENKYLSTTSNAFKKHLVIENQNNVLELINLANEGIKLALNFLASNIKKNFTLKETVFSQIHDPKSLAQLQYWLLSEAELHDNATLISLAKQGCMDALEKILSNYCNEIIFERNIMLNGPKTEEEMKIYSKHLENVKILENCPAIQLLLQQNWGNSKSNSNMVFNITSPLKHEMLKMTCEDELNQLLNSSKFFHNQAFAQWAHILWKHFSNPAQKFLELILNKWMEKNQCALSSNSKYSQQFKQILIQHKEIIISQMIASENPYLYRYIITDIFGYTKERIKLILELTQKDKKFIPLLKDFAITGDETPKEFIALKLCEMSEKNFHAKIPFHRM